MSGYLAFTLDTDGSGFSFLGLVELLIWVVWVVLNVWIWQKTKAVANLLMLLGGAGAALVQLMVFFKEWLGGGIWVASLAAVTLGFFFSVRPLVEAHLATLRAKLNKVTSGPPGAPPSGGTGTPS